MCSNVVFGFALFLLSGFLPGLQCEGCSFEEGVIAAQQTCKHSNEAIMEVKDSIDSNTQVCSKFFLFLKCVAANSSRCFDQVYSMMESYTHSPYDCLTTPELIIELQNLQHTALTSPTTNEITEVSSQPITEGNTEVTESTFIPTFITTTRAGADHGSKGEQKGPHNSSTAALSIGLSSLVLVLLSSVLPWLQLS